MNRTERRLRGGGVAGLAERRRRPRRFRIPR